MKRWQRIVLRRAASVLASVAYDCEMLACRLRAAANRKPPRPLCFPSPFEVMMENVMGAMSKRIAEQAAHSILHGSTMFRVACGEDVPALHIRKVSDAYRD